MGATSAVSVGVIFLGGMLVMVIVMARVLIIAVTRPGRGSARPACERCKYPVEGLMEFRCPECGTDLRQTGIITMPMEMRRRGTTIGAVMAWTVLMLVAAWLGLIVVFSTLGVRQSRATIAAMTMTTTQTITPVSGGYGAIGVTITSRPGGTGLVTVAAELRDGTNRPVALTTVYAPGAAAPYYSWTDALGGETAIGPALARKDILAWLGAAGADVSKEVVTAEADELLIVLSPDVPPSPGGGVAASMPHFRVSAPQVTTSTVPGSAAVASSADVAMLAAAAVLLVVWGAGIVLIVVRRRRLMAELA